MTNDELKVAIEYVNDFSVDVDEEGLDRNGNARYFFYVVKAARELLQLKDGTHTDMVMVQKVPRGDIVCKMIAAFSPFDGPTTAMCNVYKAMIAAAQKGETK